MSRAVKIAVAGTHSTGKTTFLSALAGELETAGYRVAHVADLGRAAAQIGFPILHEHTHESTLWIITRGISLELEASLRADVVLVDRPVPDALGYFLAAVSYRAGECPAEYAEYLHNVVRHHATTYDLIFKTKLDTSIPLGDDKPRDTDQHYRVLADQVISEVLNYRTDVTASPLTPSTHGQAIQQAIDTVRARLHSSSTA